MVLRYSNNGTCTEHKVRVLWADPYGPLGGSEWCRRDPPSPEHQSCWSCGGGGGGRGGSALLAARLTLPSCCVGVGPTPVARASYAEGASMSPPSPAAKRALPSSVGRSRPGSLPPVDGCSTASASLSARLSLPSSGGSRTPGSWPVARDSSGASAQFCPRTARSCSWAGQAPGPWLPAKGSSLATPGLAARTLGGCSTSWMLLVSRSMHLSALLGPASSGKGSGIGGGVAHELLLPVFISLSFATTSGACGSVCSAGCASPDPFPPSSLPRHLEGQRG
mmetsp:Transcript_34676/g.98250  ORF Transcript_34676/g.98250 Transcript_34676/m.98250 type:complete len:279 (-) Transcript_34676:1510-2346(-)